MGRKRKSKIDVIDMLFEVTGLFWQIGAVVTTCLLFFSFIAFRWAVHQDAVVATSKMLAPVFGNFSLVFYLLPLMLLGLAYLFGAKTYNSYRSE